MKIREVLLVLDAKRRDARLSQKALGERVGMSQSTISQIFSQRWTNLQLKTLSRVATGIGVEVTFDVRWKRPLIFFGHQIFTCFCGWQRAGETGLHVGDSPARDGRWTVWFTPGEEWNAAVAEHVGECEHGRLRYRAVAMAPAQE